MTIDPRPSLGDVALTVGDLDVQTAFYRDVIGLREISRDDDTVQLGAPATIRRSSRSSGGPTRRCGRRGTTGLFHLALLVPSAPSSRGR